MADERCINSALPHIFFAKQLADINQVYVSNIAGYTQKNVIGGSHFIRNMHEKVE